MIAANPKDWLTHLGINPEYGPDLAEQLARQKQILSKAIHPHESYYRSGRIPRSAATRLSHLRAPDGRAFDPELPLAALKLMERGLIAATQDLASRLVFDTVLGIESEEQLAERWSKWFETGAFWPRLVRGQWQVILSRSADLLLDWASEQGLDKIDGSVKEVELVATRVRMLTPADVVPVAFLDAIESRDLPSGVSEW